MKNIQQSTIYGRQKNLGSGKWKLRVNHETRKCRKHSHANIETETQIHPQTPVIDEDEAPIPAPRSPSSQSEQSEQPETPVIDEDEAPIPCPEESEQSVRAVRTARNPVIDEDEAPSPAPRSPSSQSEQPETPVIDEDQAPTPDELRTGKHVYADNMQLKIPLLKPTNRPAVIVETLQTVTEETLQRGTAFEPSLYEELAPEVVDKIINELRAEPDLQDIVTCIEQDLEFEQLGMDIAMLEDDLLEKELENW